MSGISATNSSHATRRFFGLGKILWTLQGFDPRPLVRLTFSGFRAGWKRDRDEVDRFTPKRTWWNLIQFRVITYFMGVNQDTMLFFMKDQFSLGEVEMLITTMPPGIGPLMVQRVQITDKPPPETQSPNGETKDIVVTAEPFDHAVR